MKTKPLNLEIDESEFDEKMEHYYQSIPNGDKEIPALILNVCNAIPDFTNLLYKIIDERKPTDKFNYSLDYLIYSLVKLKEELK